MSWLRNATHVSKITLSDVGMVCSFVCYCSYISMLLHFNAWCVGRHCLRLCLLSCNYLTLLCAYPLSIFECSVFSDYGKTTVTFEVRAILLLHSDTESLPMNAPYATNCHIYIFSVCVCVHVYSSYARTALGTHCRISDKSTRTR